MDGKEHNVEKWDLLIAHPPCTDLASSGARWFPEKQRKLTQQKAYEESKKPGTMVVMLLPARTDTSWFHDYIYDKHCEIRFIKGRLKFGGQKNPAPFPSMLVIYDYGGNL